jgi:CyaY protein
MRKILNTMPLDVGPSALSDSEYHRLAGAVLSSIEATVDRWLQDEVIDIDCQRTGGLLELAFPNRTAIVINMQPPLHELWLAARAGGYHYRHADGRWIDGRDGSEFFAVLSREASAQGGRTLAFEPA